MSDIPNKNEAEIRLFDSFFEMSSNLDQPVPLVCYSKSGKRHEIGTATPIPEKPGIYSVRLHATDQDWVLGE